MLPNNAIWRMKLLLLVMVAQLLPFKTVAQLNLSNCIYLANQDKHFLSEKIKLENGNDQIFNSLFIWEKDRVTRIIFKQVKRQRIPTGVFLKNMPSFTSIMPPIQRYELFEKKHRNARDTISNNQLDNTAFKSVGKEDLTRARYDEVNGNTYASVLKITINNWNAKHNPLADRLGVLNIQDADPNVLIKNTKRKEDYANNFPLVYQLTNDSLCIIKPYIINVYRLNPQTTLSTSANPEFATYTLYSTVSLMEDSFLDLYKEGDFHSTERFITATTLKQMHKITFLTNENSLIAFLNGFPQAEQKAFSASTNNVEEIFPDPITAQANKHKAGDAKNNAKDSAKEIKNKNEYFKYCPSCYIKTSKTNKIKAHCPIKLLSYNNDLNEIWKYAFTQNNKHYFDIEVENYSGYNDDDIFLSTDAPQGNNRKTGWQLLSPGVGYWLSNTKGNSVCDSKNLNFILDGESIKYH